VREQLERRVGRPQGGREGLYSLRLGYSEIPRRLSDTASTPFLGTGGAVLTLPAGFPAVDTAAMPLATTLQRVDLGYNRKRYDLGATWLGSDHWSYSVAWRQDVRDGTQRTSGSFFSSASHLVAPLDQATNQLELSTSYADHGLHKLLDLGVWWRDETGLPLPLGVVAARRDLDRLDDVSDVLRAAIDAGLANRDEALGYAAAFGRGIDAATADEFVAMYVNDLTLDMGDRGRKAVALLLDSEPDFV